MREHFLKFSILAAALLLAEASLRLLDPIGIGFFKSMDEYERSLTFGGPWAYLHKPGYRVSVQGVDIVINQFGLRSPPTTIEKPRGTRRVLVVGDSVVMGWGAAQDSIFPARLGHSLDARDARVEVIAAGVASWNTRTEYEWLHARGFEFDPDVVVLLVVGNDAEPKDTGHTDVPPESLLAPASIRHTAVRLARRTWHVGYAHSYLLGWVQYLRLAARQRRIESAGFPPGSPPWRDARLALDGIIDQCRERGIDLVVFLYGDDETVEQNGVLRTYRDHLAARGVPALTLPRPLFERRYRNSIVDGHENAAGHAILAREIGAVVAPLVAEGRAR